MHSDCMRASHQPSAANHYPLLCPPEVQVSISCPWSTLRMEELSLVPSGQISVLLLLTIAGLWRDSTASWTRLS